MATTLNRTFYGGSTAPGSGVYPEDVRILKVFRNYADTEYDPLGESDTSVYIPTTEKVDSTDTSILVTIQKILGAGGDPIVSKSGQEYRFLTSTSTHYVFASIVNGLVETLSIAKSDGTITTDTATTVKFVDPSLAQVNSAIADGYLPMIKRLAGQGYRYFHLQWLGSEAWFASVGAEEIARIVITGSGFTETTDKLRDVVALSLIGGGSYVSNEDYELGLAGAIADRIVLLKSSSASVTSYAYLIAVGSIGLRFMQVANDKVRLVTVSPTETPDGHSVIYEDLANGGFTDIVDFEFTDYTESVVGNIAYPIVNNKMQVQSDWDGSLANQAAFIAPSDTSNNALVRLENVQTSITWNVQIWNHSKTALLTLVPGSATVFEKDASYVIYLYGDKAYVAQVVNKDAAPVTEEELQEAITTLRSRTVFAIDVGEIAGQVNLNPNGTAGFIGTLFSPYMDFDLSANTSVVFDVEQMGNQGDMTNFVIALYEFDANTGEFNWVANTGDLSTQLDVDDRRLGLHHAKLQYLRQNAKLLGGKIYYVVVCGHWNGWAFAGNSFATTLHSSVTPAFQCDNRSAAVDPATLGTGSYAKLYATDQSDQTKVDYSGIFGNRMFVAFTNVTLSI